MSEPDRASSQEAAAPADDRRRAERYACELQPFVTEWGSGTGESSTARVRNISTTGLALVTPARVRPGRVLVIKLMRQAEGLSRPLLLRVIHSTQQPDGSWLSGGAFVRHLSEGELEAILRDGAGG
jgi:hypothetical protein